MLHAFKAALDLEIVFVVETVEGAREPSQFDGLVDGRDCVINALYRDLMAEAVVPCLHPSSEGCDGNIVDERVVFGS